MWSTLNGPQDRSSAHAAPMPSEPLLRRERREPRPQDVASACPSPTPFEKGAQRGQSDRRSNRESWIDWVRRGVRRSRRVFESFVSAGVIGSVSCPPRSVSSWRPVTGKTLPQSITGSHDFPPCTATPEPRLRVSPAPSRHSGSAGTSRHGDEAASAGTTRPARRSRAV